MRKKRTMENSVNIEYLKEFPIFKGISEDFLSRIADRMTFHRKPKYHYIYMADEASEHVFFLIKGAVKIGTHSVEGREVIKAILHPMAIFGELCLIGEEKRQDFARGMNTEIQYYSISAVAFQQLMREHHPLSLNFLQLIGNRLRRVENRLESLVFKDARTRIIEFIKDSASKRGRRVGYEMLLKHCLTQQDIANLTGTSRQTVTSVLNDLKKSNLIYFNRNSILIRDLAKLS